MNIVKWGIIGCGDVTEVKSGPAFRKVEGSELVAVMRRNAVKAEDYARRHGVERWYSDAGQLIEDPDVNAIYIATPPSSHMEYTLMAARAGKPVLVEKPMALSTSECERMIEACDRAKVPLFVAYYRRRLPRFEAMRSLIQSGAIGAPRTVSIRHFQKQVDRPDQGWKIDPSINGGGFFVDMQTHTIDWLHHTFGPVREAFGVATHQAGHYEAEDTVSLSLLFNTGVVANGLFAYATARQEEQVTVYGTEGEVSMGFFRRDAIHLVNAGGEQIIERPDPPHVHQPLIASIVGQLRGGPPSPSTGQTAIQTTRVIDQVLQRFRGSGF